MVRICNMLHKPFKRNWSAVGLLLPLASQQLWAFSSHFSERNRYCGFNHILMPCSVNNGNLLFFFLISTHYPAQHISFLACHHAEVNTSWHGPNSHALGGSNVIGLLNADCTMSTSLSWLRGRLSLPAGIHLVRLCLPAGATGAWRRWRSERVSPVQM